MSNSIYPVNKGINKSIEFKGLKAQYIWYLGGGVMALMFLYSLLYIIGLGSWICIAVILGAGAFLFFKVYAMSNKYGEHGLMKAMAKRMVPRIVSCRTRKVFTSLKEK